MAVPKKKTSVSRRGMRRSHHQVKHINVTECSNCGSHKLSHHVCPSCGYYNGKPIIAQKA